MANYSNFSGVYAAAVTPIKNDLSPDLDGLPLLLEFLAGRGCHGVLLLGTTGEGPSFAAQERIEIFRIIGKARQAFPSLRILAGTGTPSLEETIFLTRAAFDEGLDGTVILPPYYFRKVNDEGLFAWFSQVLQKAVPEGGLVLGYHIPPTTGIGFSLDLLARLQEAFPDRFAGIKDSSGDPDYAQQVGERFGKELFVLTGNDRLFSKALQSHAAGCITAMANLTSLALRMVWDAHQAGHPLSLLQDLVSQARGVLDKTPPFPPLVKGLLAKRHGFPAWAVRPPLLPLDDQVIEAVNAEFSPIVD
jgi:4-hydroxy-tetrahydrodipicolinate synthase